LSQIAAWPTFDRLTRLFADTRKQNIKEKEASFPGDGFHLLRQMQMIIKEANFVSGSIAI